MPRRIIVLEGPDGAGKSTLAKNLAESSGRKVMHTGGANLTKEAMEHTLLWIEGQAQASLILGQAVIFDRVSHISQFIYEGPPINDKPHFFEQEKLLIRLKEKFDPLVIYCRLDTVEEMQAMIAAEYKPHKSPEYLEKVRQGYPEIVKRYDAAMFMAHRHLQVTTYNWKSHSYMALLRKIRMAEEQV